MLWECCDRGGQPSAGILVVDPGMEDAEVEPGCAGIVVISELWGKGGTELPLTEDSPTRFPDPLPLGALLSFRLSSSSCSLFILADFSSSISMSLFACSYPAE